MVAVMQRAAVRTPTRPTFASSGTVEALAYIRVSSDDQEREGMSLPAQLAACRRYIAEKAWGIGHEYKDVLTGKRDDRPQYQQLLADVRRLRAEGRAVVVVTPWLHRFGRRVLERVRAREELKALGVTVHSVKEGGEVSDLVSNILASVAEEEVRQLSERVSEVRQHAKANGWHPVGRAPWGYRWRDATQDERRQGSPNKVLDVDTTAAPYVAEAFQRVAAGESVRSVGRWLIGLPESVRLGRAMNNYAVRKMLRAGVYAARTGTGSAEEILASIPGRWSALVKDGLWTRAGERIDSHHHMPRQASGRFLLTGLLRCSNSDCGARMRGQAAHLRGRADRYRCDSRSSGAAAAVHDCTVSANAHHLDDAVLCEVGAIFGLIGSTEPRLQAALKRRWKALQRPDTSTDLGQRIRQREADKAKAQKRLADAAVLLLDQTLDKQGYDAAKTRIDQDLKAADADLTRLYAEANRPTVTIPTLDELLQVADGWQAGVRDADLSAQREILGVLVSEVRPKRLRFGEYTAAIDWTPLGDFLSRVAQGIEKAAPIA